MKMIFKIAGAECRNLFYSPIAWLIILVFYTVCGYQFVSPLVDIARIQEAKLENNAAWAGFDMPLSVAIFLESIKSMLMHFYLFIPLLTMGVINRELSAGTMKLLYSSPIRTREIVFGKYLGLLAFSLLLLAIVAVLFATGCFTVMHVEWRWYLAILLSVFLLSSAYIAIGIFISSITQYQVVAGILTFAVFFILQALRDVWQQYDFFRDITYFLAMTNKAELMISGLITTRDVCYFLIIIALFLAFTLIKLKSTQESRPWRVSLFRYMVVSIAALAAGYASSRPGYVGYLDVTRGKVNSIHPAMQAALKELNGAPLTITLYTNLLGRGTMVGLPQKRNNYIWEFWEKFVEFYPNIRYKYEYYYDVNERNKDILSSFPNKSLHQVATAMAELLNVNLSRFKKSDEIRKLVQLQDEDLGLIMELEYNGKKAFLRTYPDTRVLPEQIHIAGTIRRLARSSSPKIYFTTGHYERSPYRNGEREYGPNTNQKASRKALVNMGVDIDTLSLLQRDIPADTKCLVVADPKSELQPLEQQKILDYLNKGGNAIFYGEPGKQQILNPLLQTIGVTLDPGIIVFPTKHEQPHTFNVGVNKAGITMAQEEGLVNARKLGYAGIIVQGAANISYKDTGGFSAAPIYGGYSNDHAGWIENGIFVPDSAAPVFSPAEGDVKKPYYAIGIQLQRKVHNKEQRIMVSGDADFMTPRRVYGGDIGNGMFSWMLYNDYPVYTNYPPPLDVKVKIGFDGSRLLYLVYVYILPGLVLAFAILLLIRRKRK